MKWQIISTLCLGLLCLNVNPQNVFARSHDSTSLEVEQASIKPQRNPQQAKQNHTLASRQCLVFTGNGWASAYKTLAEAKSPTRATAIMFSMVYQDLVEILDQVEQGEFLQVRIVSGRFEGRGEVRETIGWLPTRGFQAFEYVDCPQENSASQPTVEDLADGNYKLCASENQQSFRATPCFTFTKVGNHIVGMYIVANTDICVEGRVNNNTISGWALDVSDGPFRQPASVDSRFRGSTLVAWDEYLQLASQRVLNIRHDNYGDSGRTIFQAWWRYNSMLLNLNNFQLSEHQPRVKSEKCQAVNYRTREIFSFDLFSE